MDAGEQCVLISSPTLMPVLSATVLDSGLYCSTRLLVTYNICDYSVLYILVADTDAACNYADSDSAGL